MGASPWDRPFLPDQFFVNQSLALGLLALIFFTAGLGFWTYSWWLRDKPTSVAAFSYACIFWCGGILTLVLWRVVAA